VAQSVCYFTDSVEVGGAERALLLLIGSLDRASWRPTLLFNRGAEALAEEAARLGATVDEVPAAPVGLRGARRVPGLVGRLRRERFDVFHAHLAWPLAAKYPLAAAIGARVPAVVATVHLAPEFALDRSTRLQHRALSTAVGRYVAVSHDVAAQLAARLGWPPAKITVIHNGVPLPATEPRRDEALRNSLAGAAPLAVTVARLTQQKGIDTLVRAAADAPGVQFAVVGDGPERTRLEAAARSLGVADRVRFLGHRHDVPDLVAAADVFVLPSRWEGSSLALLEAMAAGKPVVATAVGGTRELVTDGETGILVPPDDATALADAVRSLALDATRAGALGAAARARVAAEFEISAKTEALTDLYRDVLKARRGRG
jgi:glycosyltransferase involved in cell wall biosynthesis